MKKKITIAFVLLLVLAAVLSITAHAAEPPQAATTISITDTTPREDDGDERENANSYTVGSYYPIEVQTAEDNGIRLLVKTFLVSPDTNPQALIQYDLERRGVTYEPTDILRQEIAGEDEKKTVSQTVTMDSETDKLDDILPALASTMAYQEDGFTGTLTLDKDSIRTREAGTSSYAYQMTDTREFSNLDRNDPAYIPKTAEKGGVTLSLANVDWTPMASGADNSRVPSLYRATALYTGTAWGSKVDGYTVTAEYTGEVSKATEGQILYRIVYEEVRPAQTASTFSWKTTLEVAAFGVVIMAVIGAGLCSLVCLCLKKKAPKGRRANRGLEVRA